MRQAGCTPSIGGSIAGATSHCRSWRHRTRWHCSSIATGALHCELVPVGRQTLHARQVGRRRRDRHTRGTARALPTRSACATTTSRSSMCPMSHDRPRSYGTSRRARRSSSSMVRPGAAGSSPPPHRCRPTGAVHLASGSHRVDTDRPIRATAPCAVVGGGRAPRSRAQPAYDGLVLRSGASGSVPSACPHRADEDQMTLGPVERG